MKLAALPSSQSIRPAFTPLAFSPAAVETAKAPEEMFTQSTSKAERPKSHIVVSRLGASGIIGNGVMKTAFVCGAGPLAAVSAGVVGAAAAYIVAPALGRCATAIGDSLQKDFGMSQTAAEFSSVVGVGGAVAATSIFALPAAASWLIAG